MATAGTRETERLRIAWETHKDRLWRAILAWSRDPEVASEAVAEAFAQAARRPEGIDDIGRWVWRAAFRIAAGILADRRREDGGGAPAEDRHSDDALPEDVVVLMDALERLHPHDREVVVLSCVGGWSAAEVATLTGSTAGAVRVRLHRARKKLRRELEVDDG